jgi:hypothetical protein
MFDDLITDFIPIHGNIFKDAIDWAEYVLQNRINNRSTINVDGLKNEMKDLLKDRLGRFWWRQFEVSIDMDSIKIKRIKINWKRLNDV